MVTCYVRHAPLHSPPAPHSPLAVAPADTGTMCSFLPVGGRTFHLLWAKVSIRLPPTHCCLNRALTILPTLASGAPHHTPCTFCSGGLKRTQWLQGLSQHPDNNNTVVFFLTYFESFNPNVWNQNCLQNLFCSHLCELTEWLSWFTPDCWFVVYRVGKREIWRSGASVLLRIQKRKKKKKLKKNWCGCFTGRLRLSAQSHPIYAGGCTQSWADTDSQLNKR